ncbi:carbonic anhydrase family protein [soil metagenome]|jgi:carbonic anhydrase
MKTATLLFISICLFSCRNAPQTSSPGSQQPAVTDHIITANEQSSMSPDSIILLLKKGNRNFYQHKLTAKNDSARIVLTAHGQFPMAVILSCIDSRVPAEEVFDQGIGDLFVARVAGNIVNEDILGSMEYACKVAGAKVIMVLGHEHCGAIKAAVDNVKMGNVTALLNKIQPAVDAVKITGLRSSKNESLVHDAAQKNVALAIKNIRAGSKILAQFEKEKKLKIIGGMYDLDSGKITFY